MGQLKLDDIKILIKIMGHLISILSNDWDTDLLTVKQTKTCDAYFCSKASILILNRQRNVIKKEK